MRSSRLTLILLALALAGCSNDDNGTGPGTGSQNTLTGTLVGFVELRDVAGVTLPAHSGVRVELVGTSFAATTDARGRWEIAKLPTGTYEVNFVKAGFSERRFFGYPFVGGGTARIEPTVLVEKPSGTINALSIGEGRQVERVRYDTTSGRYDTTWRTVVAWSVAITGARAADSVAPVVLYFNTASPVSARPGEHLANYSFAAPAGRTQGHFEIDNLRRELGVGAGTSLFARSYLASAQTVWMVDTATGRHVPTSLAGASPIVQFVMP